LPVKINQWANVVRWEKTTRPFLRTTEFLWQEGHTAHSSQIEAEQETLDMLKEYEDFAKTTLAISVLTGKKSQKEKFAGAVDTYSIEAMMLDGKCLQAGTTHYLGTNFAKAFDIKYLDRDNQQKLVHQTSWGVSTRLIGAIIMAHGDNRGLALPPAIAPIQVIIIPIASHKAGVNDVCLDIFNKLKSANIRVQIDNSDKSTGYKYNEWEMKGVPIQIAIGPNDLELSQAIIKRRDIIDQKQACQLSNIIQTTQNMLQDIQQNMLQKSQKHLEKHTVIANNMQELTQAIQNNNFALCSWCGQSKCEDKIKETLQATTRNMPFDQHLNNSNCVCCSDKAKHKIYFAKAY